MQFYDTDVSRGFVRGAYWTLYDGVGPMLSVIRNMIGEGIDPKSFWGENFTKVMKESARHTVMWGIIAEDLPDESNYVSLDPVLKDSDGLPAPKITYKRSENTSKMIDFNVDRATEALEAAGASRTIVVGRNAPPGHLLGTARMGDDPETSVVDRYGQSHDVPNLYVVDGSVFVTAPAVNPSSTIAAIAKWVAVNLVENRRNQEVAS
jgi:choline dehydrogenase-like flavoprotein